MLLRTILTGVQALRGTLVTVCLSLFSRLGQLAERAAMSDDGEEIRAADIINGCCHLLALGRLLEAIKR
jgi:hypothetical protein